MIPTSLSRFNVLNEVFCYKLCIILGLRIPGLGSGGPLFLLIKGGQHCYMCAIFGLVENEVTVVSTVISTGFFVCVLIVRMR